MSGPVGWKLWRLLQLAGLVAASCAWTWGCDTPVYHYTMVNWERDPYLVVYFHSGGQAEEDVATNDYLRRVAGRQLEHANLSFVSVDVGVAGEPAAPTPQRIWERRGSRQPPFHALVSPKNQELFLGRLSEADAWALVSSPARTRLAEELARGTHGALVLVTGSNLDENSAAREALARVIRASFEENREVGLVELARDDPAESWFLRQLLALQSDLADLDNAMVFPVFGRGHALEPYIGRGITERNLNQVVAFMNGPCACEIKSASIGMDLLTNFDWSAPRAVVAGTASGPGFAVFDFPEAGTEEPVCTMPAASSNPSAPPPDGPQSGGRPQASVLPDASASVHPHRQGDRGGPVAERAAPGRVSLPGARGERSRNAASNPVASAETRGEAALPAPVFRASAQRALTSGPDLSAFTRAATSDLTRAEDGAPLALQLPWALGLVIAAGAVVVLVAGTFFILRPVRAQATDHR